jgi:hypothetical protein
MLARSVPSIAFAAVLAACGGAVNKPNEITLADADSLPVDGGSSSVDGGSSSVDAGPLSSAETGTPTGPKCTTMPTLLVDAQDLLPADGGAVAISAAMDLAVNATDLYFAVSYVGTGAVMRVPIQGGGRPAMVAPVAGSEQALLLTGDSLVFAQSHGDPTTGWSGDIVRVGLQGGESRVLASASIAPATIFGPAGILATDGQNVYFAAEDGTKKVALAGGPVEALTTHTGALAVVGTNLVIADGAAGGVFSVPIAGGAATALATNLPGCLGPILSCGQNICWASAVEVGPSQLGTGSLMQLDPSGSLVTLSDGFYVAYRLQFDGTDFFATLLADLSFGSVVRVPAAGGTPVSIGRGGSGLALDDECLYVGNVIFGVYSVTK